jgi:hypothetical protein
MAFTENLDAFFADFNIPAIWNSTSISVIFDNAYMDAIGVSGSNPVVLAKTSDMPNVKRGNAIAVNTINYLISEPPQHDGTGMVRLELKKA